MADPSKGWVPPDPNECGDDCICGQIEYTPEDFENEEYITIKNEWLQYLEKHKNDIKQMDQNKFINSCLLLIIKQFIFEYFYESFQYKLVKMTFQIPPSLILEQVIREWPVPKVCRDEFKRPIEKKPKPPKPKKEKGRKGGKEKKGKGKDKKSKSTKSSEKKAKKPKVKKEKPHKLTKEEKEEIERLKREEAKRIEDEIAAEENKRLIFPLNLAADEQFFKDIFEGFVSPSERKEKKGKGKGKKKKK